MRKGKELRLLNLLVRSSKRNDREITVLNRGKRGRPYKYPHSFMLFLAFLHVAFLLFRQLEGFLRGLDKAGVDYTWDTLDTPEDPAGIISTLESYIQGHPELDVIDGVDGETTNRITIALKELGYPPKKIIVVGSDVMEYSAQGIKEGYIECTFTQGQYLQVQLAAIQLLNKVLYNFPMFSMKFPGIHVTADIVDIFAPK